MRIQVQVTCTFEVQDEVALRDAAFKARHKDPGLARVYNSTGHDTAPEALKVLMQHELPRSVPGVQLQASTATATWLEE